jgi:hypothetical protein
MQLSTKTKNTMHTKPRLTKKGLLNKYIGAFPKSCAVRNKNVVTGPVLESKLFVAPSAIEEQVQILLPGGRGYVTGPKDKVDKIIKYLQKQM